MLTLELSINSYKNESAAQIFVDADDDNDDAKASERRQIEYGRPGRILCETR